MQWLTQNWIWIVFAIGIFLFMRRGGMGGGMGHGRHGGGHAENGQHGSGGAEQKNDPDSGPKDPVSGERVNPEGATNSMFQGRLYYFASKENREKFEASPAQFAGADAGHDDQNKHQRHGC
jgi:YHS domain-containing protein